MEKASPAVDRTLELTHSAPGDKPRPTILQLVPELNEGGVERGAVEVAAAIVEAGGRALIASAGGRMAPKLRQVGGELITLPMHSKNPLTMRRTAAELVNIIGDARVDIVHARSRAPGWVGYMATKRTGVPFVTTYHGAYNENFPLKRFYNAVMAKGRPTIAVSNFIAEMIEERHGVADTDIVTIHRGADINSFDPDLVKPERLAQLVQKWGLLDETRPVFLLPGRLTRWKGQAVFVEACAILRERRGADFLGIMVGGAPPDSDFPDELEAMAREKGCSDCIKMVGSCPDMPAAYMLSGCVISASTDPEAFGRVAVEGQAMGRPVIATNHGGARETVDDGITGALIPPDDAKSLADAMDAFLHLDAETCAQISLKARARVAAHFSTRRMTDATLDVYERVLGKAFPARD